MRNRIGRALKARLKPSSVPTGEARLMEAIELVARVENQSRLLRTASSTSRRYRLHKHVAIAEDLASVPTLDLSVSPVAEQLMPEGPTAGADVVLLGRTDAIVRLRAFYLEAGLSAVIHGRLLLPWPREAALHRGAKVCQRLRGFGDLVLPGTLESGRGLRYAWVVEELLPGRVPPPAKWPDVVPTLLEGLGSLWIGGGIEDKPLSALLSPIAAADALDVLEASEVAGIDVPAITRAVRQVLARTAHATFLVGWCHGDPSRPNVLELGDGRLGLVDWEAARRRLIANDAGKALLGLEDPLSVADRFAPKMQLLGSGGAAPWQDQLVVASVVRLARYALRLRRVERIGDPELRQALAISHEQNVRLLARLLSAANMRGF
jgi:hypothetical protein